MSETKPKRDPEQELRNRRNINLSFELILLLIILISSILGTGYILLEIGMPLARVVFSGELPQTTRDTFLAFIGFISFSALTVLVGENSNRVKELEKIVGSEDTNEE